jgi:hypothetical protein
MHEWWKKIRKALRIPDVKHVTFVFRGWNDEQKRLAADGGNIDFLDEEIRSGRRGPEHPPGIWAIDTDASRWAEPGTKIIILIEPSHTSDDAILRYLAELGIDAEKAE